MPEFMNHQSKFVDMTGVAPVEKEEVTDAQLSCLRAKVELGQAPFVEMGSTGTHGDRTARAMKFTSQMLKDGQGKALELPGASALQA